MNACTLILNFNPPKSCNDCKYTLCLEDLPRDLDEWRKIAFITTRKSEYRDTRHPKCPFLEAEHVTVDTYASGYADVTLLMKPHEW